MLSTEARVAIGLGTLALGLGLYAAVLEPRRVSSDVAVARKGRVFDAISPHEVKKLDVVVGGLAMSLERTQQGWRGQEPIDAARVDAVVSLLDRAVALRTVDVATVGTIRGTYRFAFPSRTSLLTVGAATEVPPGGAYVRVDERAMVVSRDVAQVLLQSPLELLETVVWKHEPSELRSITIGERRFDYRGGVLFSPEGARVSRKKVDDLFSLVLTLRVQRWLPPGTILDAPVVVALGAPSIPTFALGGACPEGGPGRAAYFSGGRYGCVPDALATAVRAVAEAGADDALFSVRRDEVERVTLRARGHVFEVARKERGFHLIQPKSRELSTDEVDALERWLDKVLATSGEPSAAAPPRSESELTVKSVDGVEERVLLDARAAYRTVDGWMLAVAPRALSFAMASDLPSDPRWLLPRDLESKLSRVEIKCSAIGYEWAAAGDKWSLASHPALRGFGSRWDDAQQALRRAKRGDDAPMPKGRALCVLRLNGVTAISLFVGKDGRAVAVVEGSAFEVPQPLVEALARDFIDPGCLLGDREREVQTVSLDFPMSRDPSARAQRSQAQLSMGDLLGIVEGARVAQIGPVDRRSRPFAEWGDEVVVGPRTEHGRMFARCGSQPVTFSIDEAALKRALGLFKNAQ